MYGLFKKKYTNVHLFRYKNRFFMFDIYNFITLEISEKLYNLVNAIINNYSFNLDTYKHEPELLEELANNNYFFSDMSFDEFQDGESNNIANLSFAPIYQCNFRCKYCFAENRDEYNFSPDYFTSEMVEKTINWFVFSAYPNNKWYRIDFVSGGEPLLNFDAIRATVNYLKKITIETGKEFKVWLCTNGSLINGDICKFLDDNNISIGISLDGKKDCNDYNRVDINGKGTYDIVVDKIRSIVKSNAYSKKFRDIWGLSVINQKNNNLVEILKHHKDIGFKNVQMKFVRTLKKNERLCEPERMIKIYSEFADWLLGSLQNNIDYISMILNDNDYFGKLLKRIIIKKAYLFRCKAGRLKITICPNGDIYPCDSFVGINEYKLGNINVNYDMEFSKSFGCLSVNQRKPCRVCSVRFLCGGDCYYNSFINSSDISIPEDNFCFIYRSLCNIALWLCLEMENMYPEKYNQIRRMLEYKDYINKE